MVVEQMWQPVPGGSGTYVVELLGALTAQGARVAGLTAAHGARLAPEAHGIPEAVLMRSSRLPRTALYEAWNRLERPRAEALAPGAEVVHATTWAVPGTRLPLAVTVHDLAFLRSPEHFTRHGAAYFRRCLDRARAHADVVLTPSRATADDCVAAGVPASRLEVIPHGVRVRAVAADDVAAFRREHRLERPYVLWTGTREPRKNLPALLEAHRRLLDRGTDLDLVLVGPEGWGVDAAERATTSGPLRNRVHVTGRLPERLLAAAYSGARVFCYPSHWEGFGLPVLEAMAYGVPVVTSRGTCMEEVCGDAGLLASPDDPEEIADRIALAAGGEHDVLARAGLDRAAAFTWEASAAAHCAVYESLAEGARR